MIDIQTDSLDEKDTKHMEGLKSKAEFAAAYRFHTLGAWQHSEKLATNACVECGASVVIIYNPQPNQIDISGPAVAVNCPS